MHAAKVSRLHLIRVPKAHCSSLSMVDRRRSVLSAQTFVKYRDLSKTSSVAASPASVVMPAVANMTSSVVTAPASVTVPAVVTKVAATAFSAAGTVPYHNQ